MGDDKVLEVDGGDGEGTPVPRNCTLKNGCVDLLQRLCPVSSHRSGGQETCAWRSLQAQGSLPTWEHKVKWETLRASYHFFKEKTTVSE